MTCVTCQITPPAGHSLTQHGPPESVLPGHIGARLGTPLTIGTNVIWRGRVITLMCVEAMPGNQDDGWVEMLVLTDDQAPVLHPARWSCFDCGIDTLGLSEWPEGEQPGPGACPSCFTEKPPTQDWPDHPHTVIRPGPVQVHVGTEIHAGQ